MYFLNKEINTILEFLGETAGQESQRDLELSARVKVLKGLINLTYEEMYDPPSRA